MDSYYFRITFLGELGGIKFSKTYDFFLFHNFYLLGNQIRLVPPPPFFLLPMIIWYKTFHRKRMQLKTRSTRYSFPEKVFFYDQLDKVVPFVRGVESYIYSFVKHKNVVRKVGALTALTSVRLKRTRYSSSGLGGVPHN